MARKSGTTGAHGEKAKMTPEQIEEAKQRARNNRNEYQKRIKELNRKGLPTGLRTKKHSALVTAYVDNYKETLTRHDISLLAATLLDKPVSELKQIMVDPSAPMIVVGLIAGMLGDLSRGDLTAINCLLDLSYGKRRLELDGDKPTTGEVVAGMSHQERLSLKERLLEKSGYRLIETTAAEVANEQMADIEANKQLAEISKIDEAAQNVIDKVNSIDGDFEQIKD